ncbi:MAG: DUF881 domain-containing protein [Clostridia bacterium]
MIINLDDNRQINSSEVLNVSDYLVHEGDLTYIINELFNAGADAIAINDERITSKTSILCDGNVINKWRNGISSNNHKSNRISRKIGLCIKSARWIFRDIG